MARRGRGRYAVGRDGRAVAALEQREDIRLAQKPHRGFASQRPALSVLLLRASLKEQGPFCAIAGGRCMHAASRSGPERVADNGQRLFVA